MVFCCVVTTDTETILPGDNSSKELCYKIAHVKSRISTVVNPDFSETTAQMDVYVHGCGPTQPIISTRDDHKMNLRLNLVISLPARLYTKSILRLEILV